MVSKRSIAAVILLLAAAAAGCGESTVKRSVDARTEVLRFFPVDAPVVGLLEPQPTDEVVNLDKAAGGVPIWAELRSAALGPLYAAGLGLADLRRLVRPQEQIEGLEAAAAGLGTPTASDLADGRQLLVLATDQAELLSRLMRDGAQSGRLRPAGRIDKAVLYRNPVASYAVRDGVLVSAGSNAEVRTAIKRRDGDSDLQLDEDVVRSLFNDLGEQGPLLVYANLDAVREADLGLRALGRVAPWTGMLVETAATARAVGDSVRIEDFSKATGEGFGSMDLPLGTTPSKFEINATVAASLIPFPGPIRMLLAGLGQVKGEATATSDEVRLQLRTVP